MALCEINIRNFAIIKQLEIEFDQGLTVVTGETGAGKSIVLDALNLVLGSRAETDMIRHGQDQCEISALFDIQTLTPVQQWLAEHDFNKDNYCLIRRIVRHNKPTKCYINDQATTLQSLKELGLLLIDLHGQHEHQSLLRKPQQRQLLDDIAGNQKHLNELSDVASQITTLTNRIETLQQDQSDHKSRIELLSFQLTELDEACVLDGEFAELEQEHARLSNAQQLIHGIEQALDNLFHSDSSNISSQLGQSVQQIDDLMQYDDHLQPASELLNSALAQIDDTKHSLESALARIELDPQKLSDIEQRIDTIINLSRKHRCDEATLPTIHMQLQSEFEQLQTRDQQPEALQQERQKNIDKYQTLASLISEKRTKVAARLSADISEQMQDLGMQGGQLRIDVTANTEKQTYSEHGFDDINFLVSTNHGMPVKTLQKTASGGELSRISLAIQVITSTQSNTPTLVFDEVDVGVGGKIADIIGNRLRSLGNHAQVICITHLPQVAARGHQHLFVDKTSNENETYSTLITLNETQRAEEIARMLGGAEITERTRAHAQEMLKHAC